MNRSFEAYAWAAVGLVLLVGAALNIVKGGLLDLATALLFVAPFIFILVFRYRANWHVLFLVVLVSDRVRIPIYGLQQLSPALLLLSIALLTHILNLAIHRGGTARKSIWEERGILLIAIFLTLRFIKDRPGFVALGMEQGGLITSLNYTLACWFYFVVRDVVQRATLTRKQLRVAGWMVAVLALVALAIGPAQGVIITRMLGEREYWMLCAIMLPMLATSSKPFYRDGLYQVVAVSFLFLGVVSSFRARVFYFLAEILSTSYLTGRFMKTVVVLIVAGVMGVVAIFTLLPEVPLAMRRVFSLFMVMEGHADIAVGAFGWEDSFRGTLYVLAWEQIKLYPLIGRGFGLNVQEAIGVLQTGGGQYTARLALYALSGTYHNSVLALAVTAGLPIAILFSVLAITIPVRFARMLQRIAPSDFRTWGLVIFAFWCASTSMMLLNGGPREFFAAMVIHGFMVGMMNREGEKKAVDPSDPAQADRVTAPIAGRPFSAGNAFPGNRSTMNGARPSMPLPARRWR